MNIALTLAITGMFLSTTIYASESPVKPEEKSSLAIERMLNDLFKNDIKLKWCEKYKQLEVKFYTPLKYEFRGEIMEDGEIGNDKTSYYANYKARVWSTNNSGIPIIQDWYITLLTQKNKAGKEEWCMANLFPIK